jgi:hypothetical protein
MRTLRCHISISLEGSVAGPNQSKENPRGPGCSADRGLELVLR